ncbi:MAG: YcaO-like family protein [Heyndrickxia oleronia]|jgi:hypothetical protein|uniref:YcaO-like family protein n=1 Tax=Heyndrickxia oleronia TaxID=38875 RepID=UPI00242CE29B|nr:YcaO-like family protein [Heyndrickxia oleronia]MCI1593500.1 YcaO-like family protein [Heyndrickxia oleronia]
MTIRKDNMGFIDRVSIYRSNFRQKTNATRTFNYSFKGINGSSTKGTTINTLKAALGEHIERVSLYKNIKNLTEKEVTAYNLLKDKIEQIPNKFVSLTVMDDIYFDNEAEKNNYYNDSSGVGSHLSSNLALKSSFFEFVERQSLVFSFLTESPALEVLFHEIENNQLINKLNRYFDEVKFYDISIIKGIYVIIGIGFGTKYYGIGLSANSNLFDALLGAVEELVQCIWAFLPKEYTNYGYSKKIKDVHYNEIDEIDEGILKNPHFYSNIFFKFIDSNFLRKAFSYLASNKSTVLQKRTVDVNFNPIYVAKKFAKKFNINLYIINIPAANIDYKNKVVKFFSPECYPHINNLLIEPEKFKISYIKNSQQKFPNKHKYLPFP